VKRLRRENAELKRANAILKAGIGCLRPNSPAIAVIVAFIRDHQGRRVDSGRRRTVSTAETQLLHHR
jgi:hypothetical protein